jgi:hypothetical protein
MDSSEELRKSWISFPFDSFNKNVMERRYAPNAPAAGNLIVMLWDEALEFDETETIDSVKKAIFKFLRDYQGRDFSHCTFDDIGTGPYDPKLFAPGKKLYRINDAAAPIQ